MVSFLLKGVEAGWVTAKRHTNECVPRALVLLSTHTMVPFIALSLSCASVAQASTLGKSADSVWYVGLQLEAGIYFPTCSMTLTGFRNYLASASSLVK